MIRGPGMPSCAAADSAGAALGYGGHSGQHALSSSDLAGGMDDVRSGSSVAALQDELAEKNRIIERLQVGGGKVLSLVSPLQPMPPAELGGAPVGLAGTGTFEGLLQSACKQ